MFTFKRNDGTMVEVRPYSITIRDAAGLIVSSTLYLDPALCDAALVEVLA